MKTIVTPLVLTGCCGGLPALTAAAGKSPIVMLYTTAMRREIGPFNIGMPQLGPYGLSENWLLRHVGDLHWQMICDALGRQSRDIQDEQGNRLYASFVRVTWNASRHLSGFVESATLRGHIEMVRYSDGLFDSSTMLQSGDASIAIRLASLFSRREKDDSNERLMPASPLVPATCAIPDAEIVPPYLTQHRLLRTGRLASLDLQGEGFDLAVPATESVRYPINGYFDFNGANLLYFASYPTIADICLSRSQAARSIGFKPFVTECSPIARDVFYFGNADLDDSIDCEIAPHRPGGDCGCWRIDLYRASDRVCISRQFVLRAALARVQSI
jgi:probable biosynthetic protein (TIGR04098 family)